MTRLALLLLLAAAVSAFAGHDHGHDRCRPCPPVLCSVPDLVRCRVRRDGTLACPHRPRTVLHAVP